MEGDAVKIRRLVQNLVINAVKYTTSGGVIVSWGDSASYDGKRWMVSIQDTGPGFAAGPGAPLAGALEQATEVAGQATGERGGAVTPAVPRATAAPAGPSFVHQTQGEGIGLSIVKRLAELLDATVEVESGAAGTIFRVLLPRDYAS